MLCWLQARDTDNSLRVVAPANLHITLRFLGMVPSTDIVLIQQVMERVISNSRCFELSLQGVGNFRDSLWLGINDSEPLAELVMGLSQALSVIGFPVESRAYLPHLTIARIARNGKFEINAVQQKYSEQQWGSLSVNQIHLYESKTLPGGAEYSILHSSTLQD